MLIHIDTAVNNTEVFSVTMETQQCVPFMLIQIDAALNNIKVSSVAWKRNNAFLLCLFRYM
jgi:hypothetical protein